MQMKEILHPGVINTSAMCGVGGGALRKCVTTPFIALHKCHYGEIRRGERRRVAKQRRRADWQVRHSSPQSRTGRWSRGRCAWLLIIRFTEHKAALIGFKFLLIGIYGAPLARKEGRWREARWWQNGLRGAAALQGVCQALRTSHINSWVVE